MGGFKLTGLAAGSANGDSVRYEQVVGVYQPVDADLTALATYSNAANAGPLSEVCQHRLSLTTALPVTVTDVTGATTVYLTPDKGNRISLFDGTNWANVAQDELSMALASDSGFTGYHQSGKLFDVFYFDDAGTKRIGTGPAWTNDTTRASAISRLNGVYVNTSSMTARFGSASGNTVTLAANRGTYLGTIYCTANGQTEDSAAKRMVWNAYNRRARSMSVTDTTDSWNYTTATWRQARATATNQIAFVRGLSEDAVDAAVLGAYGNSTAAVLGSVGIGLDSTSVNSATAFQAATAFTINTVSPSTARYRAFPGLGYHYLVWLEISQATGTGTFYGDAGTTLLQSGMTATVFA